MVQGPTPHRPDARGMSQWHPPFPWHSAPDPHAPPPPPRPGCTRSPSPVPVARGHAAPRPVLQTVKTGPLCTLETTCVKMLPRQKYNSPFSVPVTEQTVDQHRLATSVRQLRHDPMEQGPTEPHAGRSTFLLSSGGAGGRVLLSGL